MFGRFGFGGSKRRNPHAAVEETVRRASCVWNSADVERRAKLLESVVEIENDRMFLVFVQAQWSQLPESTRLKIAEVLMKRDAESSLVKLAAGHIGEVIAVSYSESKFDVLFGKAVFDEGWTREHALGVWYGLGRFCLFTSIGALSRLKEKDYDTALSAGQGSLINKWRMSDVARNSYEGFGKLRIPVMMQMYELTGDDLHDALFFLAVVAAVLGNDSGFSFDHFSQGRIAPGLMGAKDAISSTLLVSVSNMLGEVQRAVQAFDEILPI